MNWESLIIVLNDVMYLENDVTQENYDTGWNFHTHIIIDKIYVY